jgi:hypothetical protein
MVGTMETNFVTVTDTAITEHVTIFWVFVIRECLNLFVLLFMLGPLLFSGPFHYAE